MNHALDHNQTVRPRFSNHNRTTSSGGPEGSWEFVSFKDGSQGVKRKPTRDHHPERSGTGDSTATDFSTTSSKSHVSNTSTSSGVLSAYRASPELISSQSSGGSFGAPVVNIISETPTTATQEGFNINRGRWYKPKSFKKTTGGGVGSNASSRSSTPAPGEREKEREKVGSQPGRGGGRPSMDSHIGEQLRMLVIGDRPIVTPPGKINDGHEGDSKSKSGQVTPTPPKSDQAIVSVQ
ncbi:hypothetical protein FS842_009668 [Serendipita sp. 407]|nr:hypothetical protein FS842_009668 [Serendipita sp. 407]